MEPDEEVRWRLTGEFLRAWLPIILSICAISLTAYQASATRRHNRLSVQPRVDWQVKVDLRGSATYKLVNKGFGPAMLREITLLVDGKAVGPDGVVTCQRISALLGRDGPDWETRCLEVEGDYILRAGEDVLVYESRLKDGAPALNTPLDRRDYMRVTVKGRYCSFYEDCFRLEE